MSKPLAFGLTLSKRPGPSKPAPPKRKPMFGGDDDSDDDTTKEEAKFESIGGDELDDTATTTTSSRPEPQTRKGPRSKHGLPSEPPKLKPKSGSSAMFGDLSSSLASRKNAEQAAELDSSVYEYDAVYDSLKPKKKVTKDDEAKKPKYMRGLMQAAETRKRDALIAEEKKIAREREEEGEEYEGKEKFVTEAYKRQQEENRKLEEEEKRREEEEAKKNKGAGMSMFYRQMLQKDEERHADVMKAAEKMSQDVQASASASAFEEDEDTRRSREEAEKVRRLQDKGADIAVNEDGQVVDKRQLLKGGLNVGFNKKASAQNAPQQSGESQPRTMNGAQLGRKQAQRERQSRMLAEQLEQSLKRARDDDDAKRAEAERSAKSRKTEGEISSAKERYLARKKAAEEAKKKGGDVGQA